MRNRTSMPEQLAMEFKRRIAVGIYPMNSFLPPERELAAEFDTSRDTISAALAILTADGLTERCRGRGTRVLQGQDSTSQSPVCIVHAPFNTPWPESLHAFRGVQLALSRMGYRYDLIGPDDPEYSDEESWPPVSTEDLLRKYRGAIYLESINCNEQILDLQKRGYPVVVANLEVELEVSSTCVDHSKTSTQAVRMLAGFGHKRIAYLGRDSGVHFYGCAIAGYRAGLDEAGLSYDSSLLGIVEATSSLLGYLKTRELLALPDPPTAIVAARDLFAEGAYQAAREAGWTVGRDISIVGYDDLSWPQPEPFLTTFREPCYEMGIVAAEMFIEKVLGNSTGITKREIESPLIVRKSAGPLL